ncbi:hypothetical protein [Halomonas sp.]|uniref:hypothetical protein n=2 Tax=Halomonas sp. TaxID=1486246 RepID=UPI0025C2BA6E|nr:hypothetical protein [Halomonas sp.]
MTHEMLKKLGLAMLVGMLAVGLAGCQDEPGPAEEAGQEIDEAMEDAGEGVEEMGESIQDAAEGN